MQFPPTAGGDLDEHVRRLMASPGDRRVANYPPRLLRRADASTARDRGLKGVALLFYDDGSRASSLQAADFLPVLHRFSDRVDVVAIDVTAGATWTDDERALVKTYYNAVVPTTVVLAADRRPLLLKYQRISAATLEAALEGAAGR